MWLDAVVTTADLQKLVDEFTPAAIPLGERGHLYFDAPAEVSLVADRGLRLRCHAKLTWPVLGIDVAITVRSMTLMLVPSIESRDGEQVIVVAPEVDALDLVLLPDIGDDEVRAFINRSLQEKRIELPWNYRETLGHQFALPAWFRPDTALGIRPNGAAIKVTNESLGLAIGIHAGVEPMEKPKGSAGGSGRKVGAAEPSTATHVTPRAGLRNGSAHENGVALDNGVVPTGTRESGFAPNAAAHAGSVHLFDLGIAKEPSTASEVDEPSSWVDPPRQRKRAALTVDRRGVRRIKLAAVLVGGFGLGCLAGLWGAKAS